LGHSVYLVRNVMFCTQHVTSNMEELVWFVDPTSATYSRPELVRQLHYYLDGPLRMQYSVW